MIQKQTYDIEEIIKHPMPQVEITQLNRNNKSIVIYRTKKENVSDPYIFYIQSMMKQNPNLDVEHFIQEDSIAKALTKYRLWDEIEKYISTLHEEYTLKFHGDIIQAVEFNEEKSQVQFIIETTEEVVFFGWSNNT